MLLIVIFDIAGEALGQARKCVAPDSKVTNSDALCNGNATSKTTIDTSSKLGIPC